MHTFSKKALMYIVSAVSMGMCSVSAVAHHSFAAYNMAEVKSTDGTLKQFRWGAPHSSLILNYTNESGEKMQMSIVSGSPLMFSKQGFNPRDFKSGEKVTVTYHPNVNGKPGGALATITLPNGQTFSDTEAASAAPPPKAD